MNPQQPLTSSKGGLIGSPLAVLLGWRLQSAGVALRFPADYINSTQERVSLYSELDRTKTEEQLMKFTDHRNC